MNKMNVIFEAILVGILTAIVGFLFSKIINVNTRLIMFLFVVGLSIHLLCEFTGLNKAYCKSGNACLN
jgi:hypothetical protein